MKPRVVFAFVEAGLGHIMPMTAVCNVFEQKYGDEVEVVKVNFFRHTKNPDMKFVEDELVKEVKLHNKIKFRGSLEFLLMSLVGTKNSLKYVMERRYKRGLSASLDLVKSLKADLIFNTHFATMYYACKLKSEKKIDADIVTYCPDPIIGRQWDRRTDFIALSSELGKQKALDTGFRKDQVGVVPFLIRKEVETFDKDRAYYRKELNIPKNNFTILLADGAYGAGKLEETVELLLKSELNLTILAVCGKNQELYEKFSKIEAPKNICFVPFGFTDKMLLLSAASDLFVGKAGASNLAEPAYFGVPEIVNFCATPIEKWICEHYVKCIKSAVRVYSAKAAAELALNFAKNPTLMNPYIVACENAHRTDGAERLADMLYKRVNEHMLKKAEDNNKITNRKLKIANKFTV